VTARERFLECLTFGQPDRAFYWETLAFWRETIRRWETEGLPPDTNLEAYFGMDPRHIVRVHTGFTSTPYWPPFEPEVIEEDEVSVTHRDANGVIKRDRKDNPELSMSQFIRFPVETREDFEALRSRLDPATPERYANLDAEAEGLREVDYPVTIYICGAFGNPRNMMGVEKLAVTYYDDPELIHAIQRNWVELYRGMFERVLPRIRVDLVMIWEDMAFKNGPLISPATFREFMLPYYQQVTEVIKAHGVPIIMVDSDGDNRPLLDLFIEGGVNAMMPFEIAAGMEPLPIREKHGRRLAILGGIDKRALSKDFAAIDDEVMRKVPALLESGGYIPCLDHSTPPDISLANWRHYVDVVRACSAPGAAR